MRDCLVLFFTFFLPFYLCELCAQCPNGSIVVLEASDTIEFARLDTFNIEICYDNLKKYTFEDYVITWPNFSNVIQKKQIDINFLSERNKHLRQYSIQCFDFGYQKIDSIPVKLTQLSNQISKWDSTIYLNIRFNVFPIDVTGDFKEIKKIEKINFKFSEIWGDYFYRRLIIIIVFLMSFMLLGYYFRNEILNLFNARKIKNLKSVPLEIIFLKKIDLFLKKDYLFKKEYKKFYSTLSEMFREYLEKKFSILALESTTVDLIHVLNSKRILKKWMKELFKT